MDRGTARVCAQKYIKIYKNAPKNALTKNAARRRHFVPIGERLVFLFFILALLICYAAARLASGLARGLALAAAAVFGAFAKVFRVQRLDTFHSHRPPIKISFGFCTVIFLYYIIFYGICQSPAGGIFVLFLHYFRIFCPRDYFPVDKYTISTETSAGFTPEMRPA